jgi:hypothetical protein
MDNSTPHQSTEYDSQIAVRNLYFSCPLSGLTINTFDQLISGLARAAFMR